MSADDGPPLLALHDDLLTLILQGLHYTAYCRLSQASQRLRRLCEEESLWECQLHAQWACQGGAEPELAAPGRRVRIEGLQSRPALNGAEASVLHWQAQPGREGRWAVRTTQGGQVETLLLRDGNLQRVAPDTHAATPWRTQVRECHLRDRSVGALLDALHASNHDRAKEEQESAWRRLLKLGKAILPRLAEVARDASMPPRRRVAARHAARAIHCERVRDRWSELAARATTYCSVPVRDDQTWTWLEAPQRAPRVPEAAHELEEAALLLVAWHLDDAQLHDSDGALAGVRAALDALAARVRGRAPAGADASAVLGALLHVLFEEERLAGNEAHYYDARNSLLDHVLRRRLGIPITLSVVTIAVAARLGLQLDAIGLPGHFMLAMHADGQPPTYVDAFRRGALLNEEQCRAIVASYEQWAWSDSYLQSLPPPEVWQRMLRNLLNCCQRDADRRVYARLLQLMPGGPLAQLAYAGQAHNKPVSYAEHCSLWPVLEHELPPVGDLSL